MSSPRRVRLPIVTAQASVEGEEDPLQLLRGGKACTCGH